MKSINLKLLIAFLGFSLGVGCVWVVGGFSYLTSPLQDDVVLEVQPEIMGRPELEDEIPEPPSDDDRPVTRISENRSSIRRIKKGGKFCEKYLLKKIEKEKSLSSKSITLKNFDPGDARLSPNAK